MRFNIALEVPLAMLNPISQKYPFINYYLFDLLVHPCFLFVAAGAITTLIFLKSMVQQNLVTSNRRGCRNWVMFVSITVL